MKILSKFRSYDHTNPSVVAMVGLCIVFFVGCSDSPSSVQPTSSPNVLVNGRAITPAGTTSGPVGTMPLNIVLSPDGKYAVTTSSGMDAFLCSLKVSDGTVVDLVSYPTFDVNSPNNGLFYGLIFDPVPTNNTYTLYAAQGAFGAVAVLTLGSDGSLTQTGTIPSDPKAYMPDDQPAGLALAQGKLYITNYIPVDYESPHPPASTLSIYKTDGTFCGRYRFMDSANTDTPCYPLAVTVKSDGNTAYVASQRDGCVYVLDTTEPAAPVLASTITDLCHPAALLLNRAETLLFVANAGSDTISVVDTANNRIISTVLLRPANVSNLPGVSPSGLALSPDETTLYASLGDFNAVAVIDTLTNQLSGYIPVGWYPTALAVSPDNQGLLVVNGWGTTAMNPNPQFDYLDPDVVGINSSTTPASWANRPGPGYVLDSIPGNVSRIDLNQALPSLAQSTVQVIENNQHTPAIGSDTGNTLAELSIKNGKIKHVIYVIKENRGYDQVLGDLPRGNGDPSLTLFGREITPNQHALAERFILLDNYYNNAPVSGEGWTWCTQGLANEFVIRSIPYIYQLALPTYQINYDFEGQNTNYITGGYPAKDQDGNWLSSSQQPASPITNVAEAPGGYIWDKVNVSGLTYRNYGFYYSTGVPSKGPPFQIPDNYPTVKNLCPPGHIPTPLDQVAGFSDYDFRRFDFGYADSDAWVKYNLSASDIGLTTGSPPGYYHSPNSPTPAMPSRFSEWNREFQEMLTQDPSGNSVPAFMMVRFMRDHTMGTNPTFASPRAMMADNDYAVGELVDAVSKSPIWNSTVIFVIEDDAQFSPDHVDSHRSFCLVISPWIKQGTLDSHFYDTISVLKSIELLLGLSPMSQYDALSNPIRYGWDTAPNNNAPYDALLPPLNIIREVNPQIGSLGRKDPRRQMAIQSSKMNWKVADAAPHRLLNEIIWKSVKGPNSKSPELQVSKLSFLSGSRGDGDDD